MTSDPNGSVRFRIDAPDALTRYSFSDAIRDRLLYNAHRIVLAAARGSRPLLRGRPSARK